MKDESLLFLRLRSTAFCSISFASFVWVVLYSIVIFLQWDPMAASERALISVMLVVNAITLVMLLVLLILEFRVWLDVARIAFLLLMHIGTAAAFAYWSPRFHCSEQIGDQQAICNLNSTWILITSWIIPALLIIYLGGLATGSYYRHRSLKDSASITTDKESAVLSDDDQGPQSTRPWLRPIMTNLPTPVSVAFPHSAHSHGSFPRHSVNMRRSTVSAYPKSAFSPVTPTSTMSANPVRLSKPSPQR